ncbi:adenylosuccinate lyase [Bacteroidia bacterium]|nr:adenylosuccinate lyase [Bacteroidia bacterium]MDB9883383.1 adenylosuccinate lyase [Bacteroidia bacterium]
MLSQLSAISPIDGRYRGKVQELAPYFSEYGLFKYRTWVEIEYFIALSNLELEQFPAISASDVSFLQDIYLQFSEADAQEIKDIEKTTNHDVKAVEYFIKNKLKGTSLEEYIEFVHFGLTSQDINNTAIPFSLQLGIDEVITPSFKSIYQSLSDFAEEWKHVPLLSRTHGQAATPTTVGKEFAVFAERLRIQLETLINTPISAKFGGATGAFNAHRLAFPNVNWPEFGDNLVSDLGLIRSYPSTQIDHYDQLAAVFDALRRIDVILMDFAKDVWQYISMDFFKQRIIVGEVGSSAMPHKVNPIDFENAEGNLGIANALLDHLSNKLPISRLQRDLTDSTVLRNLGVPLSHILIALKSLEKGMSKLILNEDAIHADLNRNWAVTAEAIQTILRREKVSGAYELLKELTRTNDGINEQSIAEFVTKLDVSDAVKIEISNITPFNYLGYAAE